MTTVGTAHGSLADGSLGRASSVDRLSLRAMRCRYGTLSGSDLALEAELGTARTLQPGEMPLPSRPRPSFRRRQQTIHKDIGSKAASSNS